MKRFKCPSCGLGQTVLANVEALRCIDCRGHMVEVEVRVSSDG